VLIHECGAAFCNLTQIVSAGLTSEAALEFMARLPSVKDLMQPIAVVEIEELILEDKRA
jgi:hypothetical protein